ncbi:MAG TPA: hypothetical protein VMC09_10495, partial [Anaerolineales bacterium]|nr:hypothetical protein [Anaerolineales bacterium]
EWPVDGWNGQSLDNKPFVTVDISGIVYVTDPELSRIIAFTPDGKPAHVWDGYTSNTLGLPTGLVSDGQGGLWVTDARNGTLVHLKVQNP